MQCKYCVDPTESSITGGAAGYFRVQKPEVTIAHLTELKEKYGATWYKFSDDTFLLPKATHLRELSDGLKKLDIKFACSIMTNTVTEEKVEIAKDMGCVAMSVGIESGNEEIRKQLNRRYKEDWLEKSFNWIHDAGIKISQYDYLMFTDAGCRLSKDWAKSMINQYRDGENYIIGLSFVNGTKNFVSKFQKIELFMLMISTLSSAKLKYPLASTGQNLSYKKDIFLSMHGFSNISNLMMGDDTIFMQMYLKSNFAKPRASNDSNSFVDSKIIYNWKDLLVQRIRWGGDGVIMWKYNKCFFIIMLITFLTNLFYIIAPFIFHSSIIFLFTLFLVKFLIEFIFYLLGSIKTNKNIYIFDFIRWFLIQIPYIVLVGFLSPFAPYLSWKSNSS